MTADDLSSLDTQQLVDAFIADIRAHGAADVSALDDSPLANRARILEALRDQSDGTLAPLMPLLGADDLAVRIAAAVALRAVDPDAFTKTISALTGRDDAIGAAARRAKADDAHCQRFGYPELRALMH